MILLFLSLYTQTFVKHLQVQSFIFVRNCGSATCCFSKLYTVQLAGLMKCQGTKNAIVLEMSLTLNFLDKVDENFGTLGTVQVVSVMCNDSYLHQTNLKPLQRAHVL